MKILLSSYEKLLREWDQNNNTRDPQTITCGSAYKAFWICSVCKFSWSAAVYSRVAGKGCPACKKVKLRQQHVKDLTLILEQARAIHGDKYDYSLVEYVDCDTSVKIICKEHGLFLQTPYKHINCGRGCPRCGVIKQVSKRTKSLDKFITDSIELFGDKFNYSKTEYINAYTYVTITCKEHGDFCVMPNSHLNGKGCNICCLNDTSESIFLSDLGLKNYSGKMIKICNKTIKPDAYIEKYKTIFEFDGDFYHGNPMYFNKDDINFKSKKKFGELYENTLIRRSELMLNKYKVISIWASTYASIIHQFYDDLSKFTNDIVKVNIDVDGSPVIAQDLMGIDSYRIIKSIIYFRSLDGYQISDKSKWRLRYGK